MNSQLGEAFGQNSDADKQMLLSFARFDPPLASFAHRVFRCALPAFDAAVAVIGDPPGLWPADIEYDLEGKLFVEESLEQFNFWATELNQRRLREDNLKGIIGGAQNGFKALISSATPVGLLKRIAAAIDPDDYDEAISRIGDYVTELRWAFLPLEHEYDFAMLVVDEAFAGCLAAFDGLMARQGRKTATLLRVSEWRFTWPRALC